MKRVSFILLLISFQAAAQDSLMPPVRFFFSGYLKEMQWASFQKGVSDPRLTFLLHNRMNLKWKPSDNFTFRAEFRNRIFAGSDVSGIPGFVSMLKNPNELQNLSVVWLQGNRYVMQSNTERLLLEFRKSRWVITAGRQRINWGVNVIWNPNDIFNAYNFLDFDYEERPGSDAISVHYGINPLSHLEIAAAATADQPVLAAKYFTHWKEQDIQFIAGHYRGKSTAGIGWAGNIRKFGVKSECQYFDNPTDSADQWNISAEAAYLLKNNWYVSMAGLYNRNGILHDSYRVNAISQAFVTPENLTPFRWNVLAQAAHEFSPIFSMNLTLIVFPGSRSGLFFPSVNYNLNDNVDIDLFLQSYFDWDGRMEGLSHSVFARIKYSF